MIQASPATNLLFSSLVLQVLLYFAFLLLIPHFNATTRQCLSSTTGLGCFLLAKNLLRVLTKLIFTQSKIEFLAPLLRRGYDAYFKTKNKRKSRKFMEWRHLEILNRNYWKNRVEVRESQWPTEICNDSQAFLPPPLAKLWTKTLCDYSQGHWWAFDIITWKRILSAPASYLYALLKILVRELCRYLRSVWSERVTTHTWW